MTLVVGLHDLPGRDKWLLFCKRYFEIIFMIVNWLIFIQMSPKWVIYRLINIGSATGMAPNKWHATMRTSDGLSNLLTYIWVTGIDELIKKMCADSSFRQQADYAVYSVIFCIRTVNYVIFKRQVKRTSQEGVRFITELAQEITTGFNTHLQETILTGWLSILRRKIIVKDNEIWNTNILVM